ncbi:alpha-N-acetylgalactosaminide alpha-2,6-sialyltransferase 3 isoform X4 [Paramormyrops kingsleyae]|uniref:alpha-N-acetylgalactosaminide alpha-2,6-sialyltransferase 3 isoform X4 n=1 Tax=Paramormyrops kingsleyae TaxID=1676925 RepID=UPI000CD6185C|nr:alpha-N-acetylgalactosaminide alpha-2,6-sialyltransferase 3 isoform X3 [Paramormyrops kingsleyae]
MAWICKRKYIIATVLMVALSVFGVINYTESSFVLLQQVFGQRKASKPHTGYVRVPDQEPLKLSCDTCSVVSSSGQILGRLAGAEIDRASCVWRMNSAPTRGFEADVGHRTSLRVVSHTSVPLLVQRQHYFFGQANDTVYVVWGPLRNMRRDGRGVVYNMLRQVMESYPQARVYVTTEERMNHCDRVFKEETGKDRTEGYRKVPYHYYEAGSRDECAEYLLHESAPYGGHRFITEKSVFAKWAKSHRIKFLHPVWSVS